MTTVNADQAAALAAARALIQGTLLTEYRRRIDARIEASPEEHCAALADTVTAALTLRAVVPLPPGRFPRAFLLHPRHGDPLPGVELPGGRGVMLFEDWDNGIAVRASSMAYLIAGGYHGARIEWSADALEQPAAGHVHELGNPDEDGGLLDDWDNRRDPECPGPSPTSPAVREEPPR